MYARSLPFHEGDEVAIITPTWGHKVAVSFSKVVKTGKNSIKLENGGTFLASGHERGSRDDRHGSYIISKERGKYIIQRQQTEEKMRKVFIEYNLRLKDLDAKYPAWLPDLKKKVREFADWFEAQDI